MDITIKPSELRGTVRVPESKSQAHRLLIASAMARGSFVEINNRSDDIEATIRCLDALKSGAAEGTDLPVLDCGESGSTLRFMLPLAATYGCGAEFFGRGRLPERPLSPLDEQMAEHGVIIERAQGEAGKILTVRGRMKGGEFTLPGNVSSQFLTGLLMALPLAEESSRIRLTGPMESKGYVTMTLDVLKYFGISVLREDDTYYIKGNQKYTSPAPRIKVEGDWSNGAFWLVASRVQVEHWKFSDAGSHAPDMKVTGLNKDSVQADRKIMRLIRSSRGPMIVDASQVPDLVPIACVLGALRERTTVVENGARLRIKESDRLRTTYEMLRSLGADIHEIEDGLLIHGTGSLRGGTVDGAGDHRIVMAAAIAAIGCKEPVTILGAEAVAKSYPGFFDDYRALGGEFTISHAKTE